MLTNSLASAPFRLSAGGWLLVAMCLSLPLFIFWSAPDIAASNLFFHHNGDGFWLRDNAICDLVHKICQYGTRVLALVTMLAAIGSMLLKRKLMGINARACIFIITVLLVGPGLITNTLFKDFWGRARPYQIQEFDGSAQYTPPLIIADQCDHNCSFFSGDGALGFSLHIFFYLVAPRLQRRTFWGGFLGGGILFGGNRVIMGSHFLSDVLFSGIFMLLVTAIIHTLFYGWVSTRNSWRGILFNQEKA